MAGYCGWIPISTFLFLTLFMQQNVVFGCSGGGNDNQGPNKNCPYGQFQCNDGKKCYTEDQKCDDQKHCDDNTDEDEHHCGKLSPL